MEREAGSFDRRLDFLLLFDQAKSKASFEPEEVHAMENCKK